jgi:hypothetical protein
MNIIEQRIRMYVQKLLISEAGGNKSGYDIRIPGTMLIGEPEDGIKRWRVERINQQAIAAGCQRGFLIIATKRPKFKTNDSLLMNDIVNTIKTIETYKNFYGDDYRIILSNPVERGKRKIYAAWLVDLRTAPPENYFAKLLKKLQDIQKQSVYQEYQKFEKYAIGSTDVIDQSRAIAWTTAIKKYLSYIEKKNPAGYSRYFPTSSFDPIAVIPDFTGMNRIKIPDEAEAGDNVYTTPKQINIDYAWKEANNFEESSFKGDGIISTDPITGITTLTPVKGRLDIMAYFSQYEDPIHGTFTGDFINGAPAKGVFSLSMSDYTGGESGDFLVTNVNQMTQFDGTVKSTTLIISAEDKNPIPRVSVELISGKAYYGTGGDNPTDDETSTYDMFGSFFEGTFKNSLPDNGLYNTRTYPSKTYTAAAQVINGKYIKLAKPVTYPFTTPVTGQIFYQIEDNPDYVYTWLVNKNAWAQVKTSIHAKFINGLITPAGFEKWINYITDPTTIAKLSAKFDKGTNYVTLKANTPIDVYNKAGKKNTYDPSKDARGTKLEWTGKKTTNNNTDWYEVLMKHPNGEWMPDGYWIRASDILPGSDKLIYKN